MEVKTQSCVVAGKRAVAVTEQNIEWNNKGTLGDAANLLI